MGYAVYRVEQKRVPYKSQKLIKLSALPFELQAGASSSRPERTRTSNLSHHRVMFVGFYHWVRSPVSPEISNNPYKFTKRCRHSGIRTRNFGLRDRYLPKRHVCKLRSWGTGCSVIIICVQVERAASAPTSGFEPGGPQAAMGLSSSREAVHVAGL